MVPKEDPQRPGYPTWASNREPHASPCHRILAALPQLTDVQLEDVAGHVERLAGWDRRQTEPTSYDKRELSRLF